MTGDLSWLDAIEARQRKHGGVTASDIARLVKALRDAHAKIARVEAVRTRLLDPRQVVTEGPLIGRLLVDHWLDAALAEGES